LELLLIRHALPERVERDDGRPADPPLSAAGHEQARRLARWLAPLPLDAVYTSPLRRARETAAPLARAQGLEPRDEHGVRELDADSSRYVPLEELKREDPAAWRALVQGGLYAGIDLAAFRSAVDEGLARIAAAHRGGRVAVVCHGGVINVFAARILGIDEPLFFDPPYTSVSRFLVSSEGPRSIASLGEAAHLREDVSLRASDGAPA